MQLKHSGEAVGGAPGRLSKRVEVYCLEYIFFMIVRLLRLRNRQSPVHGPGMTSVRMLSNAPEGSFINRPTHFPSHHRIIDIIIDHILAH